MPHKNLNYLMHRINSLWNFITNQQGKATVKLKKNTSYFFETTLNNRTMRTELPLTSEDNVSFELQLSASQSAAIEDVKVNFHVTDDKGVAKIKSCNYYSE